MTSTLLILTASSTVCKNCSVRRCTTRLPLRARARLSQIRASRHPRRRLVWIRALLRQSTASARMRLSHKKGRFQMLSHTMFPLPPRWVFAPPLSGGRAQPRPRSSPVTPCIFASSISHRVITTGSTVQRRGWSRSADTSLVRGLLLTSDRFDLRWTVQATSSPFRPGWQSDWKTCSF